MVAPESERWLPIAGFDKYEVSDLGRVRSWCRKFCSGRAETARLLKQFPANEYGHMAVSIRRDSRTFLLFVHSLVLEAFVGPRPPGMQACHFPERAPTNNRLSNLRWDTPAGNAADRDAHGTSARGTRHGCARLDDAKVMLMRYLWHAHGVRTAELAEWFRVSTTSAHKAATGRMWKHLPMLTASPTDNS